MYRCESYPIRSNIYIILFCFCTFEALDAFYQSPQKVLIIRLIELINIINLPIISTSI